MEFSGRVTSQNPSRNLSHCTDYNGGGNRTDNSNIIGQASGKGYEGSSEDTQRKSVAVPYDRRRSCSWQSHTQQLGRCGHQKDLPPICRGKRWRRRFKKKQARLGSANNAPLTGSINTSTNNNNPSINFKLPDQQRQRNSAVIRSSGAADEKSQQQKQKQHSQTNAKPLNEMKMDSIVQTRVTNADIKLTFQVQLAHGSPTGIISGFSNIIQLYQAIADCYDEISMDDILFCTVNTHRISMDALFCSNLNINDFIFAHVVGQKKEVTLIKTESALGLTITDNGAGKAFIKRIVPNTITSKAKPALEYIVDRPKCMNGNKLRVEWNRVGDFIEKINGESMVGRKHFDVARCLRMLPVGSTFTMRLIEPKRSGFNFIAPYSVSKHMKTILGANKTIRFKSDGTIVVQEQPNALIINKMNDIFESYFGFHDNDLAQTIWEITSPCKNFNDMKDILKKSEINSFNFPSELYFDVWGLVDDHRNGRLRKINTSMEKIIANGEFPDEQNS